MALLNNKRILITGVANSKSIACGIAKALHREGAELAFTYHTDKLRSRVYEIAKLYSFNEIILPCDVSSDSSIEKLFVELKKSWSQFDGFVHSIAFAPTEQLRGDYVNSVTRLGFEVSHMISSYSFVGMAKVCRSMLRKNSSLLSLTYLGSNRVVPNYNVMGLAKASLESNVKYMANAMGADSIRVNAISSGPLKTLASSGILNFKKMLSFYAKHSPIRRNVTIEEVGNVAAFLCSNLSSGITGEIIYVDGGFNTISGTEDM
ncbi:enoyl-[acyl-carrier-protein] reductase [Candidatus Blochmanniella vafra str. BVAF]|uniref:Enoyl-[acyl-carrier-protein] reductase [NADH] n=1 Tax=Blochmanniella vafra (strain BVAF) TaxID=859654 RepID=E8Q6C0_BLOVB|nr:SDR family oxidoreductase [Candidatus Blochmannia vafer]ADV33814.1 enoyl-[acyl-carrier-protein] reductase [Candidatus Blochmannia vafer str. BVAF]